MVPTAGEAGLILVLGGALLKVLERLLGAGAGSRPSLHSPVVARCLCLPGPGPAVVVVPARGPGWRSVAASFFALRSRLRWGSMALLPLLWPCCWPRIFRSAWRRRDGCAEPGWGVGQAPGRSWSADPHVSPSARAWVLLDRPQAAACCLRGALLAAQAPLVCWPGLFGPGPWGWRSLVGGGADLNAECWPQCVRLATQRAR